MYGINWPTISKEKKTEEELAKIFELSPDALVVAGLDGFFKKINPSFSKTLGFSTQEILSITYKDLVHPDDWEKVLDWQKSFTEGKELITYFENRLKTKNGDYLWFCWSVTPYLDEGLCFAVGKNITEQKKQLMAIQLSNKKLAEIAWEQSHLVRAPLTRMMGCIQYIEENHENRKELLESIKTSAYELDEIIKQIVEKAENIKTYK